MNYNSELKKKLLLPTLSFETLLLFYLMLVATTSGIVSIASRNGYIISSYYVWQRYVLITMMLAIAVHKLLKKNYAMILPTVMAALTLPFTENRMPYLYIELTIAAVFYFIVRSTYGIIQKRTQCQSTITVASIKEALDFLPSGLLFYEEDGSILLMNHQMQQLLNSLIDKTPVNGIQIEKIIQPTSPLGMKENEPIYLEFFHKENWQFIKTDIIIKGKTYYQLLALETTNEWRLIHELEKENKELSEKSKRVQHFIDNSFRIHYNQEAKKIQSKVHDVLGQHISLLYHWLQSGEPVGKDQISHWKHELQKELYDTKEKPVQLMLDEVIQTFQLIDVHINLVGDLPQDKKKAEAFVTVVREAATNAVRHGLATIIDVTIITKNTIYLLTITDNGESTTKDISHCSGFQNMTQIINALGGNITFEQKPQFKIEVSVPK